MTSQSFIHIAAACLFALSMTACDKKDQNLPEQVPEQPIQEAPKAAPAIDTTGTEDAEGVKKVEEKQAIQPETAENSDAPKTFEICESGNCKCGDGACGKNAVCIRDTCYCFDLKAVCDGKDHSDRIVNFIQGNDAGAWTCVNSTIGTTIISHYVCENPDGCSTTESKENFAHQTCLVGGGILDKDTEPYGLPKYAEFFKACLAREVAEAGHQKDIRLSALFSETELLETCQ